MDSYAYTPNEIILADRHWRTMPRFWTKRSRSLAATVAALALVPIGIFNASDVVAQELESFAILSGQTITNTGPTTILGNIGVFPGSTFTGAGSVTQTGETYLATALAGRMQDDLTTLYNVLAGRPTSAGGNLTGQELGGLTLQPGVYNFDTSAGLSVGQTLILDGNGDPNAVFIFNIGSTLTLGTGSTVQLVGGVEGSNVFYRVGSSATLGTASVMEGQIVALTSISLLTGAVIDCGAALARNGSVTLDTNTIQICDLAAPPITPPIIPVITPVVTPPTPPGVTPPTTPVAIPPANPVVVAEALDDFVAGGGTLPPGIAILPLVLTPTELADVLAELSGEVGTGVSPSGMQAMNAFIDLTLSDRSGPMMTIAPPPIPPQPAPPATVSVLGYGPGDVPASNLPFSGSYTALPQQTWGIWVAGFGERSVTKGSATLGTHRRTSELLGGALGVDYYLDPDTTIGFAVGVSGTRFGLSDDFGSGTMTTYHAGIHARREFDAAYLAGALAYGYSDVSTHRTVTIAGIDRFAADFDAHNVGGHIEAGYRLGWITPYAALRGQSLRTPAYSETTVAGASTFALDYAARTATSLRSELGAEVEWSDTVNEDTTLVLRLRGAWAHELSSKTDVNASFQRVAGPSFTVAGAKPDRDSLLLSAGAEVRTRDGFYVAGSLNSSFASNAYTYGGAIKLGYTW
ncbi:MAG: ice-binding family protein [Deltaproteobacteria bacterium]|nr:ice-binding family protein [Deltaproteobacteria bacterium]